MNASMYPHQVVDFYKTQAEAARRLDVSDTAVGHWLRQGWMPFDRQCQVQVDSGGQLIADKAHARPPQEKAA
jgi:hypothetical protein